MLYEGPFWVPLLFLRHYISLRTANPLKLLRKTLTIDPRQTVFHSFPSLSVTGFTT